MRAEGDFRVDETVARPERVRDASVDYLQLQAVVASENVDRGTAGEEVLDHLPGDFLRKGRNAGAGGTVVAGKDEQLRVVETRRQGLLNLSDLQRQTFELAE